MMMVMIIVNFISATTIEYLIILYNKTFYVISVKNTKAQENTEENVDGVSIK